MASEPKKPIEQMLEALAKARRAEFGDAAKMPNPMRARLHEEIARTEAAEDESHETRPSWITMFWPRVTVAAALATLIVLVPVIWWNQSHPTPDSGGLALRDRNAAAADALDSGVATKDTVSKPSTLSATEPTVNLADNNQIKMEPGTGAPSSESEALKRSTRVAEARRRTESPGQVTQGSGHAIASAKIQAPPVAAPAPASAAESKSDRLTGGAASVAQSSSAGSVATTQQLSQQSGVQSFRNNAQATGSANVLNTFQIQQQGNEIRVVDADGSTYTGKIEQSANNSEFDSRIAARREIAKQKKSYAAKAITENKPTTPQAYFRATGYNMTLKRNVVFEGNYEAPQQQQQTAAAPNDSGQAEQRADRARIVGTVRVYGEAPAEVDAIAESAEPEATKKNEK